MCLAIYLFSAIKIQYPQAIIITTTIRGGEVGDGENVALGPCLRLRFAFVLTQLDSTWLGLAGMDVVAAVVVLLSRAPMNFLPGCTSNEGL